MKLSRLKFAFLAILIGLVFVPVSYTHAKESSNADVNGSEMSRPIPTDPALLRGQLENGLQYYILERYQPAKSVELRLVVRAGSTNELDHERGVSHFLEHMVFNGTRLYPGHKMIDTLENMGVKFGADLNAYTGFDETTYILPIPLNNPENFKTGMRILEQLAFNATLLTPDVAQERSVIMEERRTTGLSAEARQQEHNLKLVAAGSLYAERMPIGKTNIIQHVSPNVLRQYYKRWYRPNLMSVVVVGDIDASQAKALITKHFASYTNPIPSVPLPKSTPPNNVKPSVGVFHDKSLAQTTVMLINKDSNDYVASSTLGGYINNLRNSLMVGMINQRLQALLDNSTESPGFLQAAAELDYLSGVVRSKQALHWYAVAEPNQEAKALEALHNEALRVMQHGFTQSELDRAVREHLTFLNNDSNNFQKATEYVRGIVESESLPTLEWERATQRKYLPLIQLDDINQVAKHFIQANNRIALVNSNSTGAPMTGQQMLNILQGNQTISAYSESSSRDTLLAKQPRAGKVTRTEFLPDVDMTIWTLSNGMRVAFKAVPQNDGPIIFSGAVKGGFSQLSDQDWAKTRWGFDGLVEGGLNGLSKTQVGHILAGQDLSIQLNADESSYGVTGKFTANDSESAMQMIYSLMTGVNDNPQAFKAYLARAAASTKHLNEDRNALFEQSILLSLNRRNPRFINPIPSAKAWNDTDFDTTYRTYQQAFSNVNGMDFVFVGNGNKKKMKSLVERYLGGLPSDSTLSNQIRDNGTRLDFSPRTITVAKGKEALSEVKLMFGGDVPFSADDRLALQAITHSLDIRMVERLRELEGGVYSPYAFSSMVKVPYAQYGVTVGFNCSPSRAKALITSTQDEINKLIKHGIRPQDLLKFQQAELTTYSKRTSTNEFWAAGVREAFLYDTPITELVDYPKRVLALDANKIHAAAIKYLSQKPVIAILKPE